MRVQWSRTQTIVLTVRVEHSERTKTGLLLVLALRLRPCESLEHDQILKLQLLRGRKRVEDAEFRTRFIDWRKQSSGFSFTRLTNPSNGLGDVCHF